MSHTGTAGLPEPRVLSRAYEEGKGAFAADVTRRIVDVAGIDHGSCLLTDTCRMHVAGTPPEPPSRIVDEPAAIDYDSTLTFFEGRAARSGGRPAVTVTSYQDHRPELAEERDRAEWERAEPLLGLDRRPRTLDVGCGVGRWARHLAGRVDSYLGIDFSQGLVELARTTIEEIGPTTDFRAEVGSAAQLGELELDGSFGLVIISGVLIYLNDDDVVRCLDAALSLLDDDSVLYLREPVAVASRLTLRNHWSDELGAEYHAIYRPASFYRDSVSHLLGAGFEVVHDEPIASHLQGRSETTQHFFVLRREARS